MNIENDEIKYWTVEWSESQKCFHVDWLKRILQKNTEMFFEEIETDYILLGIFKSHKDAHSFVDELKRTRDISSMENRMNED